MVVKQLKLLFYYFSINSNNFPMGLKSDFMNLWMENSLVNCDQKMRSMKSSENYIDYQLLKFFFLYLSKHWNDFLMGLKTRFYDFLYGKFLCNLRQTNEFNEIKRKLRKLLFLKTFFLYLSKNWNDFLMGLKTRFYDFVYGKFLCNLRPKN